MRYDISKATAPAMPTLGKGMAHTSVAQNFSIPPSWKELCGQITLPYPLIGQVSSWITPSYQQGFYRQIFGGFRRNA